MYIRLAIWCRDVSRRVFTFFAFFINGWGSEFYRTKKAKLSHEGISFFIVLPGFSINNDTHRRTLRHGDSVVSFPVVSGKLAKWKFGG